MYTIIQGKLRYLIKWKGYEAKKDRTWEPEENLEYHPPSLRASTLQIANDRVAAVQKTSLPNTGNPSAAGPPPTPSRSRARNEADNQTPP